MRATRVAILSLALLAAGCSDSLLNDDGMLRQISSPAALHSQVPHLATTQSGEVVMSWVETTDEVSTLRFSTLQNEKWSIPQTVAMGSDWFVNWADFPSVVPISENLWAAHWLRSHPDGGFAYDVVISLSRDKGKTWLPGIIPHQDDTATEHGFVSLYPDRNSVGAVWLDGRNTSGSPHHPPSLSNRPGADSAQVPGMTLRSVRFTPEGRLTQSELVDNLTCDCCQTDAVAAPEGAVVVYRDRTADEIRDIYLVRRQAQGWSEPKRIAPDNWRISGCPVNGPAIDARDNRLVVAWYTQANDSPRVQFAVSEDTGRNFSLPIEISGSDSLGRVDVVLLENGRSVVSWMETLDAGRAGLFIRDVSVEGVPGRKRLIVKTDNSRPAGFPRMVEHQNGSLVMAWTDLDSEQVKTVKVKLD